MQSKFVWFVLSLCVHANHRRLVSEEKFLHQIHMEEQFGPVHKTGEDDKKKMLASKKAAIGFTYEDSTPGVATSTSLLSPTMPVEATEEDDSDSDIDLGINFSICIYRITR